jgi:hypothetical protein
MDTLKYDGVLAISSIDIPNHVELTIIGLNSIGIKE